jgi:ABC-2 type transport system permease protein
MLGNLPLVAVAVLIALGVIHATLGLVIALGLALLIGYRVGWRIVSALFDRERLIASR